MWFFFADGWTRCIHSLASVLSRVNRYFQSDKENCRTPVNSKRNVAVDYPRANRLDKISGGIMVICTQQRKLSVRLYSVSKALSPQNSSRHDHAGDHSLGRCGVVTWEPVLIFYRTLFHAEKAT